MIDITNAINEARFDTDDIWRVARNINLTCEKGELVEMETVPKIIHIEQNLTINELSSQSSSSRVGICSARCLSFFPIWKYADLYTPMTIIHLNNPKYGAVNGMRFSFGGDWNQNYYITSGQLSGCTFAVLLKENNVYFAHAGKDLGTNGTQNEEYNNRCIYNVVCALNNESINITNSGMTTDKLVEWLTENKYVGIIAKRPHHGTNTAQAKTTPQLIHVCEYTTWSYVTSIISKKQILNAYFSDGVDTSNLRQSNQYIWDI